VNIPGFKPNRINTANVLGDTNAYPGGGPALLAETIRQLLGIRIDKYVLVNFDVFTAVVNAVSPNGTQICVEQVIDDPHYPDAGYGIIPVHFDPGCQVLDAERLLQYARTRATAGSDFDRAKRQQQVLRALQEQVLSAGGVVQFIGQAPTLYGQLSQSIKTNMTLEEIIQLAVLMGDIPKESIRFGQIDNLYVDLTSTTAGEQVLVPRPSAIRLLLQQVFNTQDELSLADLKAKADAESASIVVFNNTDVAGLAGQTRDWLTAKGVNILEVGNTPAPTNVSTVIHVYTDKIWTARYLAALMGLPPEVIKPGADGMTTKDVAIIVGPDIQPILAGTGG